MCSGNVAYKGTMRNAYKIFVRKPEKRPPVRPRHKWEDNINMYLKRNRVSGCGLYSSGLGDGPMASSSKCGNETSSSITGDKFLDQLSNC
jgi:hypothetical protein